MCKSKNPPAPYNVQNANLPGIAAIRAAMLFPVLLSIISRIPPPALLLLPLPLALELPIEGNARLPVVEELLPVKQ